MIKHYNTQQKGFVILFAVLISAVILLIGAGVFSISVKEAILSSSARESQYAINAADAGLECILYDDLQAYDPINPTVGGHLNNYASPEVHCFNTVKTPPNVFKFEIPNPQGSQETCAHVTRKDEVTFTSEETAAGYNSGLHNKVVVYSRGFNLCNGDEPAFGDLLLVERVMRATYIKAASPTP